ncbi:unnamed protein product [Haemonchus placei]|uniref:CCHC-type domain-containing protein n=1 Tax=Haemonchus placei TaxID=6290 RepID=A0A0N4X453_HAEPC|nr:unnamed protein product [Haemonchus placei]
MERGLAPAVAGNPYTAPTAGEKVDNWRAVRTHYASLRDRVSDHSVQARNESRNTTDGHHSTRTAKSSRSSRASSPEYSQESISGETSSVLSYNSRARPFRSDGVDDMFTVFREVFKAQTVANVSKYDGKNSLTDFLRALEVKFPSALWTDSDKRDILVNHLEGVALSIYKGLPPLIREGTYDDIVSALKMARRNPCERLKNIRDWEQLSKRPNETVVEFCCRMEDLSRRIHPSSEWDFIRGSKLYSCLQHWHNSYHMLAALDASDDVYTEVRRVAMRLEKLQADEIPYFSRYRGFQKGVADRQPIESQKFTAPNGTDDPTGTRALAKPSSNCCHCGKTGHAPVDCRRREKPRNHSHRENGPGDGSNRARQLGSSLVTELDRWCKTVQSTGKEVGPHPSAVGKPSTCEVEIFGVAAKALVDTGSVVSIVPVGLLKQVRERGTDLDAKACIVGNGKQRKLYDASGNGKCYGFSLRDSYGGNSGRSRQG